MTKLQEKDTKIKYQSFSILSGDELNYLPNIHPKSNNIAHNNFEDDSKMDLQKIINFYILSILIIGEFLVMKII